MRDKETVGGTRELLGDKATLGGTRTSWGDMRTVGHKVTSRGGHSHFRETRPPLEGHNHSGGGKATKGGTRPPQGRCDKVTKGEKRPPPGGRGHPVEGHVEGHLGLGTRKWELKSPKGFGDTQVG